MWRSWVERPERLWARNLAFQLHFWLGAAAAAYILLMSVTGSAIVFRNELSRWFSIERVVDLHTNLIAGTTGRLVNGLGALTLTFLCLTGAVIWWPGVRFWRRSLTVEWRARFPRIMWDLHSALGFWFLVCVLVWGVSGIYFAFPRWFDVFYSIDPGDRVTDPVLYTLARVHFGRFGWVVEALWVAVGLVPAVLAFTGVFICCRRVMFKKPSNPKFVSE